MKKIYTSILMFLTSLALTCVLAQSYGDVSSMNLENDGALKSASPYDLIRLEIKNAYLFDATVIYFHDSFQKGIGPEDSEKMFNPSSLVPEIFTHMNNANLSINGFPMLYGSGLQLPVCVKNRVYDECEIFSNLETFASSCSVILEDTETQEYTNLREGSYKYIPSSLGICSDRFILHIASGPLLTTGLSQPKLVHNNAVSVSLEAGALMVNIPASWLTSLADQAGVEVYNMAGQKVKSLVAGAGSTRISLPGGGLYIIKIAAGSKRIVKKVVLQRS